MKLRFDPESPTIVVTPTIIGINGRRKVDMALDTGATYIMIPWDIAAMLGYSPELSKERVELVTLQVVLKKLR